MHAFCSSVIDSDDQGHCVEGDWVWCVWLWLIRLMCARKALPQASTGGLLGLQSETLPLTYGAHASSGPLQSYSAHRKWHLCWCGFVRQGSLQWGLALVVSPVKLFCCRSSRQETPGPLAC